MSTMVIHHSADFDGLFCREIAARYFAKAGGKVMIVGWDYSDPVPEVPAWVKEIYMLDISVEALMGDPRLIWIDHHASAIAKFGHGIRGYRIDGVAACRLAYQWFFTHNVSRNPSAFDGALLPGKVDFIERRVNEPLAVRLAGEYDIWDRRDPNAELLQHGLRSCEIDAVMWESMLDLRTQANAIVRFLLENGKAVQYAKTRENESIAKNLSFTIDFEGLKFCAINAARYNSHLFTAGLKPEHDGCFGFNFDGKKWRVSLYHAPGKEHLDLSKIAVKYGGGGHKGACGFTLARLPLGNA